jgi:hypothetical protein
MFEGRTPTKSMHSLDWLGGQASCYADLRYTICEVCVSGEGRAGRHRAGMRSEGLCTPAGPRRAGVALDSFTTQMAGDALAHRISAFAPTVTGRSIAPSPDRHKNAASPIRRARGERLPPHPALSPMGERDEGFARPGAPAAGRRYRA